MSRRDYIESQKVSASIDGNSSSLARRMTTIAAASLLVFGALGCRTIRSGESQTLQTPSPINVRSTWIAKLKARMETASSSARKAEEHAISLSATDPTGSRSETAELKLIVELGALIETLGASLRDFEIHVDEGLTIGREGDVKAVPLKDETINGQRVIGVATVRGKIASLRLDVDQKLSPLVPQLRSPKENIQESNRNAFRIAAEAMRAKLAEIQKDVDTWSYAPGGNGGGGGGNSIRIENIEMAVLGDAQLSEGLAQTSYRQRCESVEKLIRDVVGSDVIEKVECGTPQNIARYPYAQLYAYMSNAKYTVVATGVAGTPVAQSFDVSAYGQTYYRAIEGWQIVCSQKLNEYKKTYGTRFLAGTCGTFSGLIVSDYSAGRTMASKGTIWLEPLR